MMAFSNLGLLVARIGFGADPQPSHVELTRQMILACDPVTRKAAPGSLLGLDLSRELENIAVPTLVICGTNDVITPPAESRRIARKIPGARLELLDGGGHMLMLERAERVDELIVSFAHEVQGARPGARGDREATG
jgi:3-oxoadipate enol-lactonase